MALQDQIPDSSSDAPVEGQSSPGGSSFDLDALNAQFANDPQWQKLVHQFNANKGQYAKYGKGAVGIATLPFSDYLKSKGINIPSDLGINPTTGRLNQSWTNTTGGALGYAGLVYAGMLAGGYGATAALGGGGTIAGAAPVLGDGTTLAADLGSASALAAPTAAGATAVSLGTGATLATDLGGASAITAPTAAGATAAEAGGGATLATDLGGAGALDTATGTGAAVLPSTSTVGTAALPGAGSTVTGVGSTSLLTKVGRVLTNKGVDNLLGAVGQGIGNATNAATNNRYGAADQNIRGNQAYETELMNRSKTEADQRHEAAKDAYRQSWYANRQPGPYDPRPLTPISAAYQETLNNLGAQANKKLATGAAYDSSQWNDLKPYEPTQPGTLEQVGTWLSPILTGIGSAYKAYKS